MDDLDFAILNHLQEDGRKPFTEIAKALGVTEGTIRNRVAKLTADETLKVIGLVDPHHIGFDTPALISVSVQPGLLDDAVAAISKFPEVSYLLLVAGEYDLMVEVMCRDRSHLTELVTGRLHKVPGVTDTRTTFILHIYNVVQPDLNLAKPLKLDKSN
ncbi:MAG: Lrp/AsnC family transcriptional regulator [Anaerolineales bacterium]|nr:Lrp/AsnC family transcriptional regulator [Anaerolineales bacterium]